MVDRTQKSISFELNIKSLRIALEQDTPVTIYWVRGNLACPYL